MQRDSFGEYKETPKKYTTEADKIPSMANTMNSGGITKGDYKETEVRETGDQISANEVIKSRHSDGSAA